MFLHRQALVKEACLFNLMNTSHQKAYNALLAEEGRSVFILKQKEWGVTGFAAPDMEADYDPDGPPPIRIKDDAFYLYILYNKTPTSPWKAPNRAELYKDNVLVNGKRVNVSVPRGPAARSARADEDDDDFPFEEEEPKRHVVIDISQAKGRKGMLDKAMDKAKEKLEEGKEFTAKRIDKAPTVREKVEVVADAVSTGLLDAFAEVVKGAAQDAAKDAVEQIKATSDDPHQAMAKFLGDQFRKDPGAAREVVEKAMADHPDRFKGKSADQIINALESLGQPAKPKKPAQKKPGGKPRGRK